MSKTQSQQIGGRDSPASFEEVTCCMKGDHDQDLQGPLEVERGPHLTVNKEAETAVLQWQ